MSTEKDGVLIPDREARRAMAQKRRAGQLPPRRCPAPRCHKVLADPDVPPRYKHYADTFGLAKERRNEREGWGLWECPFCGHRFGKHRLA